MSTTDSRTSYVAEGQDYKRDQNYLPDRITADGRDGWPVEPGQCTAEPVRPEVPLPVFGQPIAGG